jgi:CheY-like chemotaxis protein/anti-sigma regulatory factor (Ser/Thr protein kinase)
MSQTVLIAEDDSVLRKLFAEALASGDYRIVAVGNGLEALEVIKSEPVDVLVTDVMMPGMDGIDLIEQARHVQPRMPAIVITGQNVPKAVIGAIRNQVCDLLLKPFSYEDLRTAVSTALSRGVICAQIEVISCKPDWIEIRVPCDLDAVEPLYKLMVELEVGLPRETREGIGSVFREMLNNAIEHGGQCDPSKQVEVKYIRLKRAIIYSIKDPGEGFDLSSIEHAAVANPADQPYRHMQVRQQMGIRPGGYGILLASQVIDELVYNERHNELVFVKYLDETPQPE